MYCSSCGNQINDNAKFCENCGAKAIITLLEPIEKTENINETIDNDTCLLESKKVNYGFGIGQLYAYNNRLEYISKKNIKSIFLFEDVKNITTLGSVFTLILKNGKSHSFGIVDGVAKEWIKLVKQKVEKQNTEHIKYSETTQNYKEIVNELINTFKSNRIDTVKAFSNKTGLNLTESKKIVDKIYEERLKQDLSKNPLVQKSIEKQEDKLKVEQLKKDKIPYCPKCHSTSLSANKKGFGFGKAALGLNLGLDIGLLAGGLNANKIEITCLNCGYKFKPGKK